MRDSELLQDVANRLRQLENMCANGSPALQSLVTELGEESVGACDRVWARWGNVIKMAIGNEVGAPGAGVEAIAEGCSFPQS